MMKNRTQQKFILWIHSFPNLLPGDKQALSEYQQLDAIQLSLFKTTNKNDNHKRVFAGNFNEFIEYVNKTTINESISVVLPANSVLFTNVSVPSKSSKRIRQALPFLLDDQLISDINTQYFAIGDIVNNESAIAIINKPLIKLLFDQFKKHTLPVITMTSELMYLPWKHNEWSMTLVNDKVLLRINNQNGLCFDYSQLQFIMQLLLNDNSVADSTNTNDIQDEEKIVIPNHDSPLPPKHEYAFPDKITLYINDKNEFGPVMSDIAKQYDIDVDIKNNNILQLALQQIIQNQQQAFNLFQGEFDPTQLRKSQIPFLKSIITVACIALISQISFMSYYWYSQKQTLLETQNALEKLYFSMFPKSTTFHDVSQVRPLLERLQQNSVGANDFIHLLGVVGEQIQMHKPYQLKSLRFNDGELQIEIQSNDFIFNQLKSNLKNNHAIIVEQKNAYRRSGQVFSLLHFRKSN